MAACVVVNGLGYLVQDPNPPADQAACAVVVLSGAELGTLTNIYGIPASADLQGLWVQGFSIPVVLYCVAMLANQAASFFGFRD